MTEAERNAAWDQSFDVALGDFDKRLGREQTELEKERAAGGGAGVGRGGKDGGAGGAGGATGAPPQMPGEVSGGSETGVANAGAMPGGGGIGNPTSSGPRYPAPPGMPDGANDDVVARQLREAAEKEADPELRTKLWEEYRKYKTRKS